MSVEHLKIPFSTWRQVVDNNGFQVYQQRLANNNYNVWCGNLGYLYEATVGSDDFVTTYSGTYYTSAQTVVSEDEAVAYIIGVNSVPSAYTSAGRQVVSLFPTEGSRATKISHRWNDPTTWREQATQYTDQACTATSSGTTYSAPHTDVIDVYHGKLWEEELFSDYRLLVEVDEGSGWVEKTEVDPHTLVGDYTADYTNGSVAFSPAVSGTANVRASYYAATTSVYTLAPTTGKVLLIKSAEVQFSADTVMSDTVIFELYGYTAAFAPHLVDDVSPNYVTSFPSTFKIPLKQTIYKTMSQFFDESNGAYPVVPAISASNWRGMSQEVVVFPWDYAAAIPLSSAAGMEIRIYLEHDAPFLGSYATATLYCLSEDE